VPSCASTPSSPSASVLNYAAVLTDVNGKQWTVYSGPITSTVSSDVISDAIRGVGAAVKVESPLGWKRDRDASQFNINGRIVVVGKPRSARSGDSSPSARKPTTTATH
jgi:hypothetical protein